MAGTSTDAARRSSDERLPSGKDGVEENGTRSPERRSSSESDGYYDSKIDEKKLVRKIDLRVMPMLFIIYVAAFLDRYGCPSQVSKLLTK